MAGRGGSDARSQPFRSGGAAAITVSGLAPRRGPYQRPLTLGHLTREPTIYLVSECGDPDEEQACLQAVFSIVFEDQLDGWWRDRTTWPTPRSLDVFTRWFDCQFHSMLLDLTDEPLIDEEI
jgi:hypothetical protein